MDFEFEINKLIRKIL